MAHFGNIFDIDNYTDFASGAVDTAGNVIDEIHNAGVLIGGILKTVSPALAFIPGLGTALAVGVYAAGAISAKDPITDAVIGTASAGMPPGLPKIGFDTAANITRDVAEGHNAFDSALDGMRKAAAASGPQAQAAFDAALNMARGGKIDSRLIAEAKANFAGGGKSAEMAFDAGIALANGQSADQAALEVARNYIRDQGGPLAAAAFDSGIALSYGQTLQEAGFAGLHTLVRGNNPVEMIINFVQQVGASKAAGMAVPIFLQNSMVSDAMHTLKGAAPSFPDFSKIKDELNPIVKTFQDNLGGLDIPSGELAHQWGLDEAMVRAGQSLVDRTTGAIDQALLDKFNMSDTPGNKERNDQLEMEGQALAAANGSIGIHRSRALFTHTPTWVRGFDIGVATANGNTQFGPGQAKIRDSIPTEDQYNGFNAGRDLTYSLYGVMSPASVLQQATVSKNIKGAVTSTTLTSTGVTAMLSQYVSTQDRATIDALAKEGAALAAADSRVAAIRNLVSNGDYRWGFDVGSAIARGSSIKGPGQDRIRNYLGPTMVNAGPNNRGSLDMQAGFDAAQALQFGITKSGTPAVTAGNLLVQGLSGSGFSPDQKAGVVSASMNNPAVAAGASAAIQEKTGFFHALAVFFGLA